MRCCTECPDIRYVTPTHQPKLSHRLLDPAYLGSRQAAEPVSHEGQSISEVSMTQPASPSQLLNLSTELAALVAKAAQALLRFTPTGCDRAASSGAQGSLLLRTKPWRTRVSSPSSGLAATRSPHNSWDATHPRTSPSCASIALICSRWQLQRLLPPWGRSP